MIYLYVKIHNKTGLKYLGKTEKDPYIYNGSGKYWKKHLYKHGVDIKTIIIHKSYNKEEIKSYGIFLSNLWNIVKSEHWANLKLEEGDGGNTSKTENYIKAKSQNLFSKHTKNKSYEEIYGEEKAKILKESRTKSNIQRGKRSDYTKSKISESRKRLIKEGKFLSKPLQTLLTCPHCGKITTYGNAYRWHFNKCKILSSFI